MARRKAVKATAVSRNQILDAIMRLENKLDAHTEQDARNFDDIKRILLGDGEKPGFAGRLDRLEQADKRRKWHYAVLYTAILGFLSTVGATYFK